MIKNNNINYFIFTFFTFIFFISPRITFLKFSFLPTSIRIEDLLIFLILIIYITQILKFEIKLLDKLFIIFFIYLSINYLNGFYEGQQVSIFNYLRFIEIYFMFVIGRLFCIYNKFFPYILAIVLFINFIIIILQYFELFPAFRSQGIYYNTSARAYGLFGGPWELAAFYPLSAMVIHNNLSNFKSLILATLVTFFCILAGSRSFLLTLPIYLSHKFKFRYIFVVILFGIIFSIILMFLNSDTIITYYGRLLSLTGMDNFRALLQYNFYTYDPIFKDWIEYNVVRDDKDPYFDLSLSKRFHKWSQVLFIYSYEIKNFFLGVGVGVFGNAVDGGWIRFIGELGIVGVIIFLLICYYSMTNKLLFFMFMILFTNMLFIDIYQSIKIIGLIFFTVGLHQKRYE